MGLQPLIFDDVNDDESLPGLNVNKDVHDKADPDLDAKNRSRSSRSYFR